MTLFLGVDGGQSSTTAVVGDPAGHVLGSGTAGPCNHARKGEGRAKLERALTQAVEQALEPLSAKLADTHFAAACLGMSGGPDDKREIIQALIHADSYDVTTDAHIALFGAIGDRPGSIVIAGTGSIALSRDAAGDFHRAGGWGYVFGDEGSGFDIARQGLRAVLQAEEGWGPTTELRAALLEATGAKNANDLLHRWYAGEFSREQTATWSQVVDSAARRGDSVARAILDSAGAALAKLGLTAHTMAASPGNPAPICPIGGVFTSDQVYQSFAAVLATERVHGPALALATPALGALNAASQGIQLAP